MTSITYTGPLIYQTEHQLLTYKQNVSNLRLGKDASGPSLAFDLVNAKTKQRHKIKKMLIILSDSLGNANMSECLEEFLEKGWTDSVFHIFL